MSDPRAIVEEAVRRVTAEVLGVRPEDLVPEISLRDDLAADSLDLCELAVGLEMELGVEIRAQAIEEAITFGDLLVLALGYRLPVRPLPPPVDLGFWAQVVAGAGGRAGLRRAGWITPYATELLAEDAIRAGVGARLELLVPPDADVDGIAWLHDRLDWLAERGIAVHIRHRGMRIRPGNGQAAA